MYRIRGECGGSRRFSAAPLRNIRMSRRYILTPGIPCTFAELDARGSRGRGPFSLLNGPGRPVLVAVADVAGQLADRRLSPRHSQVGGTVMVLDTTLPDALITHMLNDAKPVIILTRGQDKFRDLPTLDVLDIAERDPAKGKRRVGSTTRHSALLLSFTPVAPPACPRAWSVRTQAMSTWP